MKFMRVKIIALAVSFCCLRAAQFEQAWSNMQETYRQLIQQRDKRYPLYSRLVHSDWINKGKNLSNFILGSPTQKFLSHPVISGSMVRHGYGPTQQYEERYLCSHTNPLVRQILDRFKESSVGGLARECSAFNCSSNSLGQLFYLAKTVDKYNKKVGCVVELGGGYGALARITQLAFPESTYVIIDVPEVCAIQQLYLNLCFEDKVQVHIASLPQQFAAGKIHIVPIYLLPELNVQADAFISAFAITESTFASQDQVIQKNFFGAPISYIVGLASSPKWVNIGHIIQGVRGCYPQVSSAPYHGSTSKVKFYEIIGQR